MRTSVSTFIRSGERASVDLHAVLTRGPEGCQVSTGPPKPHCQSRRYVSACSDAEARARRHQRPERGVRRLACTRGRRREGILHRRIRPGLSRALSVAVVEPQGRVVAFANLWLAADREEICVDLIRKHDEAPRGVMESLSCTCSTRQSRPTTGSPRDGAALGLRALADRAALEPAGRASVPPWRSPSMGFQGLRAFKESSTRYGSRGIWSTRRGLCLPAFARRRIPRSIAGGYGRIFVR